MSDKAMCWACRMRCGNTCLDRFLIPTNRANQMKTDADTEFGIYEYTKWEKGVANA